MDILGLEPIQATIVIAFLGVLLQVGLGVLQSKDPFDGKKVLSSAIIAVFTSIVLVAGVVGALPDNTDPLVQLTTIVTLVGTIAGIDQIVKNGGNAILAKSKK